MSRDSRDMSEDCEERDGNSAQQECKLEKILEDFKFKLRHFQVSDSGIRRVIKRQLEDLYHQIKTFKNLSFSSQWSILELEYHRLMGGGDIEVGRARHEEDDEIDAKECLYKYLAEWQERLVLFERQLMEFGRLNQEERIGLYRSYQEIHLEIERNIKKATRHEDLPEDVQCRINVLCQRWNDLCAHPMCRGFLNDQIISIFRPSCVQSDLSLYFQKWKKAIFLFKRQLSVLEDLTVEEKETLSKLYQKIDFEMKRVRGFISNTNNRSSLSDYDVLCRLFKRWDSLSKSVQYQQFNNMYPYVACSGYCYDRYRHYMDCHSAYVYDKKFDHYDKFFPIYVDPGNRSSLFTIREVKNENDNESDGTVIITEEDHRQFTDSVRDLSALDQKVRENPDAEKECKKEEDASSAGTADDSEIDASWQDGERTTEEGAAIYLSSASEEETGAEHVVGDVHVTVPSRLFVERRDIASLKKSRGSGQSSYRITVNGGRCLFGGLAIFTNGYERRNRAQSNAICSIEEAGMKKKGMVPER